jgi:two-component system KDP operon response regulator KdpE
VEHHPSPANLPRLLLIDASAQSRAILVAALGAQRFEMHEAASAAAALQRPDRERFDLILLDLDLPDSSGFDLIATLRRRSLVPIVVLSSHPDERSLIDAFDRGADDYVAKPVNIAKLTARLRAALRHRFRARAVTPLLHYGEIAIDPINRRVTRAGRDVKLSPTEFDILTLLTEHAGKILTHDFLLRRVWGPNKINDIQYLRVYVRALRQKLGAPDAQRHVIRTESGVGYRFMPAAALPAHGFQPAA